MTSSASSKSSGGRIPASRLAIIVLPAPGGPTSSRLWPPAAAISSARRASNCPRTSSRSGTISGRVGASAVGRIARVAPRRRIRPEAVGIVQRADRVGERGHADDVESGHDRGLAGVREREQDAGQAVAPRGRRQSAARRASGESTRRATVRRAARGRRSPGARPRRWRRGCRARSAGRTTRRPCARPPARGSR